MLKLNQVVAKANSLDWRAPDDSPAELFAFVDLESVRIWLVKKDELPDLAQQHSNGRYHFFMMTDPTAKPRKDGKRVHDYEFEGLLLWNRIHELVG